MSLNSVQSFVIENCNGPTFENGLNNVCLHPLSRTFTFTFYNGTSLCKREASCSKLATIVSLLSDCLCSSHFQTVMVEFHIRPTAFARPRENEREQNSPKFLQIRAYFTSPTALQPFHSKLTARVARTLAQAL